MTGPRRGAAGLARRLASMLYESLLVFAVGFAATWIFFFASGGRGAGGSDRIVLQIFLLAVISAYFLRCWLRGGQTLAMKAWRIRLESADGVPLTSGAALLRFALALVLLPSLVSILWAIFDRDRQFLHDRLAGTRLVRLA